MSVSLLVALPDDALLSLVGRSLSGFGYRVDVARGGVECLTRLRREVPDILILDQDIPWGGGEGVLELLRTHDDLSAIPVVLITAESPDDLPTHCLMPPVVRWMRKPFNLEALQGTLRALERLL